MNAEKNSITETDNNISASDLKNRFKEGSIPLQTDFANLIDIADIGRRAVGKAPDQTNNPNSALEMDDSSGLAVKVNPDGGLKAKSNGISVKMKDHSLISDVDGLAVNKGKGLYINDNKLEINNNDGIEVVNEGVKVKASNGINVDSSGVSVKAKREHGGIAVNEDGVSIIPDTTTGIMITQNGLGIYLGDGLKCDKAGEKLHVDINAIASKLADLIIPRGTIVPFYGNDDYPPAGWAWCDGGNDRPDLNTNREAHDSGENINIISGWGSKKRNYWQVELGHHVCINVYFMRYMIKI
ncbi:phage tail protein [Photorhabdus khanii]|uniref:Tail fiber protein n=1 Tax=Photorhabdus khanii subsp. guanajuatensis TaxID=2100166 RepID=A0A4R4JS42_9GAMM|nr:phage tail protein [Photorhabdus khanii]TDB57283.1 hypothetical protein C5467_11610 [Photorhabdus khanii subsp. guanajuatensis]